MATAHPRYRVRAGDATGASARLSGLQIRSAWGYEGAQSSRRLKSWTATSAHVNALLAGSAGTLRNRVRQLIRSNPYMAAARETYSANLVGTGIKPSSLLDDPARRAELQAAWFDWTDRADHDGRTDFYGQQRLVADALFDAGECFVRLIMLSPREAARRGLAVPLQLQLLEADMVPLEETRPLGNGNHLRCGIEFDAAGRRVAYLVHRRHPGDSTEPPSGELYVRVPAEEMVHVFDARRPGQIRGEPRPVAAMVKAFLLDQYDDAELDRKKIAALFAGFVTKPTPDAGDDTRHPLPADAPADDKGIAALGLQPGTMVDLLPGEDIKFSEPADVGGSYEAFQYRTLLALAAGMGLPYAAVTGDVTKVNYGSQRAAILELRRRLEPIQHGVIVHQLCRPVIDLWMTQAVLAGALAFTQRQLAARAPWRFKWIPPKWDWVDPQKDRAAEATAVQNGFKSRASVIEAEGLDPEEVDAEIARDRDRADKLGIGPFPLPKAGLAPPVEDDEKPAAAGDEGSAAKAA